jgi:hypothetical protein
MATIRILLHAKRQGGTALDGVWALNPTAYRKLTPLGGSVGILFRLLGATLTMTGIG